MIKIPNCPSPDLVFYLYALPLSSYPLAIRTNIFSFFMYSLLSNPIPSPQFSNYPLFHAFPCPTFRQFILCLPSSLHEFYCLTNAFHDFLLCSHLHFLAVVMLSCLVLKYWMCPTSFMRCESGSALTTSRASSDFAK